MLYKAEFEDEEMEIFDADNHEEAVRGAYKFEKEHGTAFNLFLLNDKYDEIERLF
ncbi:hypothetical protein [Clostridium tyrobutyricum]|uniref:hypothetical protein n=1 Tax=Clostridium tyrobutyricum TaxID=1519 RepID=UPI000B25E675|nr:hypothetical protein [Clostridium tyrobutyricum]MBV4426480.1 hypothetical protein [Clostridium tyrobutyricum]MBV4439404.1 hypothetical protein [Clostridium tyrobutyricum]